jgi:signal transduction histidine kinase/CheY-like chemotaxis protein
MFSRLPEGVFAVAPDGRVTHANRAASAMVGVPLADLIGCPVADFVSLPDGRAGEPADGHPERHSAPVLATVRRADGTEVAAGVTHIAEPSSGHRLTLWLLRDLSAEAVAKEKRCHAQKLEAIGRLAGGVAHDFNNLLTVISGYAELLLDDDKHWANGRKLVGEVHKAANRAAALTRQLLAFGRRQQLCPKVVAPNSLLGSLQGMLRRVIREDIDLSFRPGAGVGEVVADEGQLENAVMNLVVNARDAMPGGGRVLVETSNQWLDETYARTRPDVRPGWYVMIAVTDTGCGMSDEVRANIFQPFFTTKDVGHGTGLGLASVHGFVNQSGGHIHVYSEVGRGTTFKIYLPRVDSSGAAVPEQSRFTAAPRGAETILLVEDDREVREVISSLLTACGYTVLAAGSVAEALLRVAAFGPAIRLIVSDLVMSDGGGAELVRRARPLLPDVPVLFLSGYSDDAAVALGMIDSRSDFLQKPIPPFELATSVRQILDRARPVSA